MNSLPCIISTKYPDKDPTIIPKIKINNPVEGSMLKLKMQHLPLLP